MNNKAKKPYSTPSRTIKGKGKNNTTARVMKKVSDSRIRKNSIPSRTEKSMKEVENKKNNKSTMDLPKARIVKSTINTKVKSEKTQNSELEHTTRIRIDEGRINDFETLDTSFLEGRIGGKSTKRKKEKVLKEKKSRNINFGIVKNCILSIIVFAIIFSGVIFLSGEVKKYDFKKPKSSKKNKVEEKIVDKSNVIDDNYLFVGDFYTKDFSFEDYDYHYVKVSEDDFTTRSILDNMNNNIYRYNPSIVFLQLGIVDLDEDKSSKEILDNYKEIVDKIKENRPYTKIYIVSLYPINKDVKDYDDKIISKDIENDDLKKLNDELKKLTESKEINYLDLFSVLSEDDKLKDSYTDNGIELNDEAYDKIKEEIEKIVG